MTMLQTFEITVKGYKPQTIEITMLIDAQDEDEACFLAMKLAQDGAIDLHHVQHTNADSDLVWEEAELTEDDD